MAGGTFREDLFYRLAVVQMVLPPLRDRENDVRLLAQYFLSRFAPQVNKPNLAFDPEAIRALDRHSWPGNVRELENCVRRAAIMAEGRRVLVHLCDPDWKKISRELLLDRAQIQCRRLFKKILALAGGIVFTLYSCGFERPIDFECRLGNKTREEFDRRRRGGRS